MRLHLSRVTRRRAELSGFTLDRQTRVIPDGAERPSTEHADCHEQRRSTIAPRDPGAPGGDWWTRRPHRSANDRKIAGVAGGLGRAFGVDPVLFRVGFVILTLRRVRPAALRAGLAAAAGGRRRGVRRRVAARPRAVVDAAGAGCRPGHRGRDRRCSESSPGDCRCCRWSSAASSPWWCCASAADGWLRQSRASGRRVSDWTPVTGGIRRTTAVGGRMGGQDGSEGRVLGRAGRAVGRPAALVGTPGTNEQHGSPTGLALRASRRSGTRILAARPAAANEPDQPEQGRPGSPAEPAEPTPPAWDPLGVAPFAWDLPEPTPLHRHRRRVRHRSVVGRVTMGAVLLVGGLATVGIFAGWWQLSWAGVAATALAVVAHRAADRIVARPRPVADRARHLPLAVTLALAITGIDGTAGYGQQTWAPTTGEPCSRSTCSTAVRVSSTCATSTVPAGRHGQHRGRGAGRPGVGDRAGRRRTSTSPAPPTPARSTASAPRRAVSSRKSSSTQPGSSDKGTINLNVHVGAGQAEVRNG